ERVARLDDVELEAGRQLDDLTDPDRIGVVELVEVEQPGDAGLVRLRDRAQRLTRRDDVVDGRDLAPAPAGRLGAGRLGRGGRLRGRRSRLGPGGRAGRAGLLRDRLRRRRRVRPGDSLVADPEAPAV